MEKAFLMCLLPSSREQPMLVHLADDVTNHTSNPALPTAISKVCTNAAQVTQLRLPGNPQGCLSPTRHSPWAL